MIAASRVKDLAQFYEDFREDLSKDAKRSLAKGLFLPLGRPCFDFASFDLIDTTYQSSH